LRYRWIAKRYWTIDRSEFAPPNGIALMTDHVALSIDGATWSVVSAALSIDNSVCLQRSGAGLTASERY